MSTQCVIVAGGRTFGVRGTVDFEQHKRQMYGALLTLLTDWTHAEYPGFGMRDVIILSGMAAGADTLAIDFAVVHWIPFEEFPADWDKYGKSAGYRRNEEMAKNADTLVAFWDGESRGTKHMIDIALREGLEVHVYRYAPSPPGENQKNF